jgi:hypothetical protein
MLGLLSQSRGGLLGAPMIRQVSVPFGSPQPSPFMMAGGQSGPPPYGSDEWATQTGGPGAMIWREMIRYMADNKKAPLGFLDPNEKAFSPWLRQYLGPQFQKGNG